MNVLVCAASKHGATTAIAAAIAAALEGHGLEVRHADPGEVATLEGVDAVVLGSAVYAGHWLEPAKDVVARLGPELARRPVWLFSSGPVGDPPQPNGEPADVEALRERTGAIDHRVFAGRLDRSRLGRVERGLAKMLRAPEGDFRDWDGIRSWGREIAATLQRRPTVS